MMVEDRGGAGPQALQGAVYAMMGAARNAAGLQQVFGSLALDPGTADHAGSRARLDAKLQRLEERLENELGKADRGSVSVEEAENSYRLLGAHRGLSEALINFSQRVGVIDWPRRGEARF